MGLNPINRLGYVMKQTVRAIYRITPIKRTIDSGLAFLQAQGHGDPRDVDNREILQEADLDDISHFGFESFPPMDGDTEYTVVDADGGLAAIASRRKLPTSLADLVVNESRLYGEDDQSVLCKTGGDIEVGAAAGQKVKLGNGDISAAILEAIAYADAVEANASKVATNAAEAANSAAQAADFILIQADLLALGNSALPIPIVPTFTALTQTWGNNSAGDEVAYVKTGSGTSEVEP